MINKVYKFFMYEPVKFYKAGQYFAQKGWKHKDIVNDGDYELFIVLKGAAFIQIGNHQYSLHEHDCLLIPPHIRHIGFSGSPENTEYYWMHFFPVGEVETTYISSSSTRQLKHSAVIIPQQFEVVDFERLAILIRQMLDTNNDKTSPGMAADYFISSILIELSRQFVVSVGQRATNSSKFELIKNWIRIHSHEKLSVSLVANEFQVTPVYLTKLFRENEHTTTIHFINLVKIKQSVELLLTTNLSVKEIAYELNFTNEKYFLRVFKQTMAVTPTKFRNSYSKTYLNNIEVDPTIPIPKNADSSEQ
ncbi:helix-turn-helix domain-containing protein [Secundilactobacillus kimchicus]|nr:AraC family transcriptional regulator [Secundilactobacillus kimchicus]MBT9671131.1 helix-turn-helix domain-containing protein [Secundilactobacillus kimchicus]